MLIHTPCTISTDNLKIKKTIDWEWWPSEGLQSKPSSLCVRSYTNKPRRHTEDPIRTQRKLVDIEKMLHRGTKKIIRSSYRGIYANHLLYFTPSYCFYLLVAYYLLVCIPNHLKFPNIELNMYLYKKGCTPVCYKPELNLIQCSCTLKSIAKSKSYIKMCTLGTN